MARVALLHKPEGTEDLLGPIRIHLKKGKSE